VVNSTDLEARARMGAFIGNASTFPDYTSAWILTELNDQQTTLFEKPIVNTDSGYWLKSYQLTVTAGIAKLPVPPRAITGGFAKIDIAYDSNLNWQPLDEYGEHDVRLIERTQPGPVAGFILRGDSIVLLPVPDSSTAFLRISYYLRPSRLQTPQNNQTNGGTDRGRITSIASIGSRQVTVNAIPFDQELSSPAAISSGGQLVDIVRPNGWHEVQLVGASQTFSGFVFTLGGTDDLSTVQVGDYIRVAEQTDWPALPDDFARCLADATAVKIMLQLNMAAKAKDLASALGGDMLRFQDLISPRVKNTGGEDVVAPVGLYRGWRRSWIVKYP
jgi:hypothetical protein